jgi:hypothetical protein
MYAGAARELQQYAPAGTCQTHNVVPINRAASSSSLDLQERVKRSNAGGDIFDIEVSVTRFSNFWTFSRREARRFWGVCLVLADLKAGKLEGRALKTCPSIQNGVL